MNTELEQLARLISKLPGIGMRSARRITLDLISDQNELMLALGSKMVDISQSITPCKICGNYDVTEICAICNDHKREHNVICVVEQVADLWAIERSRNFRGVYHVLGGTLSAIAGRSPDDLRIDDLIMRIRKEQTEEVILATNSTLEGQTTAFYIAEMIAQMENSKPMNNNPSDINASSNDDQAKPRITPKITRLAQGMPIGGELDYIDEGTLGAALLSRKEMAV